MTTPADQTQTLRLERVFDCPPDVLWDAWTVPEAFARWICPVPGCPAEVLHFDPRPGGRLAWTMPCPAGRTIREEGVFTVLDRPRELVIHQPHDHPDHPLAGHPLTLRARFLPEGGRTRLIVEHAGFPPAMPLGGSQAGLGALLDKLAALVGALR